MKKLKIHTKFSQYVNNHKEIGSRNLNVHAKNILIQELDILIEIFLKDPDIHILYLIDIDRN